MSKTHRRRDRVGFRRFQRAMRTDTALKARSYRERERHEEQLAHAGLRKWRGERLSWRSLVQSLQE